MIVIQVACFVSKKGILILCCACFSAIVASVIIQFFLKAPPFGPLISYYFFDPSHGCSLHRRYGVLVLHVKFWWVFDSQFFFSSFLSSSQLLSAILNRVLLSFLWLEDWKCVISIECRTDKSSFLGCRRPCGKDPWLLLCLSYSLRAQLAFLLPNHPLNQILYIHWIIQDVRVGSCAPHSLCSFPHVLQEPRHVRDRECLKTEEETH